MTVMRRGLYSGCVQKVLNMSTVLLLSVYIASQEQGWRGRLCAAQ